jgi:hypothetical protein
MSQFLFYLRLEPYLKQWLQHALGNPVQFPAKSNENAIIRRFLTKRPEGSEPQTAQDDLTAIVIPDSKAKPPQYYNWVGPSAARAITECIEDLFRRNLWTELDALDGHPCGVNKLIVAWCEMHGINEDHSEAVRQKYYRMRKAYTEKGINLVKSTRNHTDDEPDIEQLRTILYRRR